ncbi:MAG: ComF family protein [bacterium]|nr:ComF family protein [bacterium]
MSSSILPSLYNEFKRIVQLSLFLSQCRGCGNDLVFREESIICRECKGQITLNHDPACSLCGRIMTEQNPQCGECLIQPPPFRKHTSYARYRDLLRELILAYKYGGIEKLKHLFIEYYIRLFNQRIRDPESKLFDYIVPVPPDKSRKREFDPILQLAKGLSKELKIPLLPHRLIKIKKTLPQAGLSRAKRLKNLDGAFQLNEPHLIEDKKVLLIDDVYTTGTTMTQCARLLSRQNADVTAMTLGRS